MNEWDALVARQVEADGVRMASGQHIGSPIPRHDTTLLTEPWISHQCAVTAEHDLCNLRYVDGRLCTCKCHTRPIEMAFLDREFPDDPDARDPWIDRRDHYDR